MISLGEKYSGLVQLDGAKVTQSSHRQHSRVLLVNYTNFMQSIELFFTFFDFGFLLL